MIEIITKEDADAIRHARNMMHVLALITEIVQRLPVPRLYVAEAVSSDNPAIQMAWEIAFDEAVRTLEKKGLRVIDPTMLRNLAELSPTASKLCIMPDGLLTALVGGELIQEIVLPREYEPSAHSKMLHRFSTRRHLRISWYRPPRF